MSWTRHRTLLVTAAVDPDPSSAAPDWDSGEVVDVDHLS